jgi:glycine C-acetyltransferase
VTAPTTTTPGADTGAWEALSLAELYTAGRKLPLRARLEVAGQVLEKLMSSGARGFTFNEVVSGPDRFVRMVNPFTGEVTEMAMFGSNNYLGLANHPEVFRRASEALSEFGVGSTGAPVFNGYTRIHRELEERLAAFKGCEAALLFSSGFAANTGVLGGLVRPVDSAVFDEFVHASFWEGLQLAGCRRSMAFTHNSSASLEERLGQVARGGDVYVGVEGVYSMDGDIAPLDEIVAVCKKDGAILIVDDAHATGVVGPNGRGTSAAYNVEGDVDIITATLGKGFGVLGGFVAGSHAIIDYLRFVARSHLFSTAIPPAMAAAVLAGLDILESEPERRDALLDNVRYATKGLKPLGLRGNPETAILALPIPADLDPAHVTECLWRHRVFVNYAAFPAVPKGEQRFRVSIMATHTREDLDRLIACMEEIWAGPRLEAAPALPAS